MLSSEAGYSEMNQTQPPASERTVWQVKAEWTGESSAVGALKDVGRQGSIPSALGCAVPVNSLQL